VDAETSWRVIEHERLSLAALLETLSDDEWNAASLCEGWRVKDVAAHVALAPQPPSPFTMVVEGVRAGGRFHKANRDFSVRHANRPGVDLVAELREHAASRRLPKVTVRTSRSRSGFGRTCRSTLRWPVSSACGRWVGRSV